MDAVFKALDILGRFFVWLPQGQLDRNVVGILKDLLNDPKYQQRRFDTLLHDSAIYEETPGELRKVLIRIGARRYRGSGGEELWGFPGRNKGAASADPYPLARIGGGIITALIALAFAGSFVLGPREAPDTAGATKPAAQATETVEAEAEAATPAPKPATAPAAEPKLDCTVRVTSPFVKLRATPGFAEPEGSRVAQGPYNVLEVRTVRWANKRDFWVQIETEGKLGWIAPSFHNLDMSGAACP